jgi:hypothetical protein
VIRGDCKGDPDRAARRREDNCIDPHHIAGDIERRPARIAFIDGRIDLKQVFVGVRLPLDVAAARRNDPCRHCPAQTERIANGDDPVADLGWLFGELHVRKVPRSIHLNHGKVACSISPDHPRSVRIAVICAHLDPQASLDDMIAGYGVAVCRNKEAGSL